MSKLIKEVKAKREELKKKMADLRKEARLAFTECVKSLFDENPELVSFSWTQYTPYFNDGDTCYFRANTSYPEYTYLKDGEKLSYDENYGEGDEGAEPQRNLEKNISEILGLFEEDEFKEFFGDHCRVTVTRNDVEVDEYDHD